MKRLIYLLIFVPFLLNGQGWVNSNSGELLIWENNGWIWCYEGETGIVNDFTFFVKVPEIPDCILHLSTSKAQFSDGDMISLWADNTFYQNDATQGTGHNQPTYDLTTDTGSLEFVSDDYMDLGTFAYLDGATEFTISLWIYWNQALFTDYDGIFSLGSNGQRVPWIFGYDGFATIFFQFETEDGALDCNIESRTMLEQYKWTHIVARWDGTNCNLYFDGVEDLVNDVTTGEILATNDGSNWIGRNNYNYLNSGKLDDIMVFTRALNTTEIDSLYANKVQKYQLIKLHFNDSAEVLFGRIEGEEPIAFKNAASEFYDSIQAYHVDDALDFLYNFAAHNENGAVQDWLSPRTATPVNTPVHTAYEGYLTNGSSSYIKTNYNPGTDAVHYNLNSMSLGYYIRTNNIRHTDIALGCYDGSGYTYVQIRTSELYYILNNGAPVAYVHSSDISGFTIATRQNSTTLAHARNSAAYSIVSNNTNSIVNQDFYIGCNNNNSSPALYTNNQFSWTFGGGQLTELQKTKLYEIIEWAMDQYGKGVN